MWRKGFVEVGREAEQGTGSMTELPREYLEGCARYALGLLPWSAWESWFLLRAKAIEGATCEETFGLLMDEPEVGVSRLLEEQGVKLRPRFARPAGVEGEGEAVSTAEYAVYSALFQDGVSNVARQGAGIFDGWTEGEKTSFGRGRLEFDASLGEFFVVEEELRPTSRLVRPTEPQPAWKAALPELQARYEWLNRKRWPLEKRFAAAGGCRFPEQCSPEELKSYRLPLGLSRVGFSSDGKWALVYLRHGVHSGEYVVLEQVDGGWREVETWVAWMS